MNKAVRISYDDKNDILCAKLYRLESAQDVHDIFSRFKEMFLEKELRYELLDATEFEQNSISKDVRKAFADYKDFLKSLDKFAVLGATNLTRMVARVVCSSMGISRALKFFNTEEEAIAWLKEK